MYCNCNLANMMVNTVIFLYRCTRHINGRGSVAIGPTILTGEEDKCKKVAIIIPSIEAYGEYGLETKIKELVEKYKPTEISIINQGKGMMAKYYTGSFVTERARLHAHLHIAEREYDEIRKYLEEKKIAFYD